MNVAFVDLQAQYASIKSEIDKVMADVIAQAAFIGGPYLQPFEAAFAQFCSVKHCVGVGNGTDAIFIALKALGIGQGDEVITVANSFIATSEAITQTGARVVFVDIDPKTYNIDISQIESKITSKTKAIIPVHLYGQPVDMDAILAIAKRHRLKVIEDAAQAHGAMYKGRRVGSLGDVACFSFYPGKNLGAYGDAGAIVTDNDELAKKTRMFANHGRIDKYDHELEGINSRMDGLQAAILGVKLKYLKEWTEKRRKNARLYNELLKGVDVVTPCEIDNIEAVYHLYVVRVKKELRQDFQAYLKAQGIATGIHYPIALPNLKAYSYMKCKETDFPEATRASFEIVSLPMYPELKEAEVRFVADNIKKFLDGKASPSTR